MLGLKAASLVANTRMGDEAEAGVRLQKKRMTIIIKALSSPKCEGFIRLNPNVFVFSVGF